MSCGCRVTQHIKEFDPFAVSSSSSSSTKLKFSSLIKPQYQNPKKNPKFVPFQRTKLPSSCFSSSIGNNNAFPLISCLQSKFPPILSDCSFSQREDDGELSSGALSTVAGGIVALGKFDALHVGHRELAIQASKVGAPFLLSFAGMAEVLGWPPRAPIVAKCDRDRVLSSWAPLCGNVAPKEFLIDFAGVRHLTPRQFVEKLSKELGVHGVVAGENYRFGYKAAGDAAELVKLCDEYGLKAYIINSVMDKNQDLSGNSCPPDKKEKGQVSSTRVRYALSKGDINYVSELLGRDHRLILAAKNEKEIIRTKSCVSAPKSCLLNLPPKEGLYENCSLIVGEDNQFPCKAVIDPTHIHIEVDDENDHVFYASREIQILSIEFKW